VIAAKAPLLSEENSVACAGELGRQDLSVVTAKGRTLVVYALPANSIKELYVGYRPTTVPSMSSWVRPKNCILSCRPLNAISTTARSQSDSTICSCCRGAVSGTQ
jgi:hypothetical protein